jgi:hypothetical protein
LGAGLLTCPVGPVPFPPRVAALIKSFSFENGPREGRRETDALLEVVKVLFSSS